MHLPCSLLPACSGLCLQLWEVISQLLSHVKTFALFACICVSLMGSIEAIFHRETEGSNPPSVKLVLGKRAERKEKLSGLSSYMGGLAMDHIKEQLSTHIPQEASALIGLVQHVGTHLGLKWRRIIE